MKHLLNDLSEEEKNSILEQHQEGGKKIVIENFNKLVNTKSGEIKPFVRNINEQTKYNTAPTGWDNMKDFLDNQNVQCGKPIVIEGGREGSAYRFYENDKNYFINAVKDYYKTKCNSNLNVPVYIDLGESGLPEEGQTPGKKKIA